MLQTDPLGLEGVLPRLPEVVSDSRPSPDLLQGRAEAADASGAARLTAAREGVSIGRITRIADADGAFALEADL